MFGSQIPSRINFLGVEVKNHVQKIVIHVVELQSEAVKISLTMRDGRNSIVGKVMPPFLRGFRSRTI